MGAHVENLFDYEYFEIIDVMVARRVFSLAQLGFGAFTGLTASF